MGCEKIAEICVVTGSGMSFKVHINHNDTCPIFVRKAIFIGEYKEDNCKL